MNKLRQFLGTPQASLYIIVLCVIVILLALVSGTPQVAAVWSVIALIHFYIYHAKTREKKQ